MKKYCLRFWIKAFTLIILFCVCIKIGFILIPISKMDTENNYVDTMPPVIETSVIYCSILVPEENEKKSYWNDHSTVAIIIGTTTENVRAQKNAAQKNCEDVEKKVNDHNTEIDKKAKAVFDEWCSVTTNKSFEDFKRCKLND